MLCSELVPRSRKMIQIGRTRMTACKIIADNLADRLIHLVRWYDLYANSIWRKLKKMYSYSSMLLLGSFRKRLGLLESNGKDINSFFRELEIVEQIRCNNGVFGAAEEVTWLCDCMPKDFWNVVSIFVSYESATDNTLSDLLGLIQDFDSKRKRDLKNDYSKSESNTNAFRVVLLVIIFVAVEEIMDMAEAVWFF